jgi:hypothetical protein
MGYKVPEHLLKVSATEIYSNLAGYSFMYFYRTKDFVVSAFGGGGIKLTVGLWTWDSLKKNIIKNTN